MFCPRCGKPTEMGETTCTNCGLNLDPASAGANIGFEKAPESDLQIIMERVSTWNIRLIIFCMFALAVLILCFIAAYDISNASGQILQIRTADGKTINEVYYREMAKIYSGYAMFIRACGVFFFGVLVRLGFKK